MSQIGQLNSSKKILVGGFPQAAAPQSAPIVSNPAASSVEKADIELSPLAQLHANVRQLEDLNHRMGFMMSELSELLK